jgi:hypothetical protein
MKALKIKAEVEKVDDLITFYENLGWQRGKYLDPTKIKINPERWNATIATIGDHSEPGQGMGNMFQFMNIGPSTDPTVKYDTVHVYKGAF